MSVEELALNLPRLEKIRLMEVFWSDISTPQENFDSPQWHRSSWAETEARYNDGIDKAVDWNEAKRILRTK